MAVRTCVRCGAKSEKNVLKRFVWRDGKPFFDQKAMLSGRGVYCCDAETCYNRLIINHKKWKRFFRL